MKKVLKPRCQYVWYWSQSYTPPLDHHTPHYNNAHPGLLILKLLHDIENIFSGPDANLIEL